MSASMIRARTCVLLRSNQQIVRAMATAALKQEPAIPVKAPSLAASVAATASTGAPIVAAGKELYSGTNLKVKLVDNVAVVTLDDKNNKVNVLNESLTKEFDSVYDLIASNPAVKAAVVISGKPNGFIAGADISMLAACTSASQAQNLAANGQRIFNKISDGKLPVVAAIHGEALGGGLEVALACHYRMATNDKKTKVGLPEVQLGLLPGAGGTQRLPRLIGLMDALPMLLTGSKKTAQQAKKLGLVDVVINRIGLSTQSGAENTVAHLESAAIQTAKDIAAGKIKIKRDKPLTSMAGLKYHGATNFGFGRDYVLKQARAMAMKQTNGLYPAPLAILDVVKTGLEKGITAGLEIEARRFGELSQTKESASLIGLFFGMNACKKVPEKFSNAKVLPVKNIGILGAGLMGAGIAEVSMGKFGVVLKDSNLAGLGRGLEQIQKGLDGTVKKKKNTQFEADTLMSSISTTTAFDGFNKVDLVIEAVPENLALKHKVIKELEQHIGKATIFASNTSALPITDIAKASSRPENVVGMHYFSPVPKMQLLEIIPGEKTSPEVTAAAFRAGVAQGKVCIVVKDVPGFYVNRSLGPYMAETMALVAEGADPLALDKALTSAGFPVGPIVLADEVGIDVAAHVQTFLGQHLGVRMSASDPAFLNDMISNGLLGRKSNQGFFVYPKGKGKKTFNPKAEELINKHRAGRKDNISVEDMQNRSIYMFVNEAAYCLQDGIILNPIDGDIGLVFGCGFLPNRGGPFRFLDSMGVDKFVSAMHKYADIHGERFKPAQILVDYAKAGKKFHTK